MQHRGLIAKETYKNRVEVSSGLCLSSGLNVWNGKKVLLETVPEYIGPKLGTLLPLKTVNGTRWTI